MNYNIRVATYNLRYANNKDTGNLWSERGPVVINLVRFHNFDILATQEGLKKQLDQINNDLPYYDWFGVARDDGEEAGEHAAIFFKKSMFQLLGGGTFWLSESPDQPGHGWDARHNRICTWVKLELKNSGRHIFVFNAHFDHYGIKARNESSKLVLHKIASITKGAPTILTGDFNADPQTECYHTLADSALLSDAAALTPHPYIHSPSFNSWGVKSAENKHIDHIFLSSGLSSARYGILTDTYNGKPPSDHYPVMAEIILKT
jgi:endonuclease/exonuclease/phosphatase family metal-dependent hydrolase